MRLHRFKKLRAIPPSAWVDRHWDGYRGEQLTDLAEALAIRAVPKFQFYKDGKLLEQFPSRDRHTIASAINKHAGFEVLPVDHH